MTENDSKIEERSKLRRPSSVSFVGDSDCFPSAMIEISDTVSVTSRTATYGPFFLPQPFLSVIHNYPDSYHHITCVAELREINQDKNYDNSSRADTNCVSCFKFPQFVCHYAFNLSACCYCFCASAYISGTQTRHFALVNYHGDKL